MKKVVAALAVFAACSIGPMALAGDSETQTVKGNVEIYGVAKMSVDLISTNTSSTAKVDKNLTRVSSNSSRLGVKGREDLGDGLSAVMQLELGVNFAGGNSDGTAGTVTYRNSYAGLSHKALGTLIAGIYDTPYKISTGSLDPFADTMGDYNAIIGNVNGSADFDVRATNSVMYMSPDWGGFQLMVATSEKGQGTSNDTTPAASEYSASVSYTGGPFYAALARETHKNGFLASDKGTKISGTKAGAGLSIGGTKIGLVYEALKDDKADSVYTRNAVYGAVSQKLGSETIKLAYGKADDGESAADTGATLVAFGIDHSLSKRTTVYALYAKTKNDSGATYGLGQSGAGGAYAPKLGGENPSVVSFGINHSF